MTDADVRKAMELVAALKVVLLADADKDGGLTEASRHRAWIMARDVGYILLRANGGNL